VVFFYRIPLSCHISPNPTSGIPEQRCPRHLGKPRNLGVLVI
jgi:hypothetical protein